jgi:hypothetical protein
MHTPRLTITSTLKAALEAALGAVPVFLSPIRELPRDVDEAVAVFAASEVFTYPNGRAFRAGEPVKRDTTVGVVVYVRGRDEDVGARSEELCRLTELVISRDVPELTLSSCDVDYSGQGSVAEVRVTYALEISQLDKMEH